MKEKFKYIGMDVTLDITPGIYFLERESAIGKTYLGHILKDISRTGVFKYYYIDNRDMIYNGFIEDALNHEYDIIFLDRYDMYYDTELLRKLGNIIDKTIILADIKNVKHMYGKHACAYITLGEKEIVLQGKFNI